MLGTTAERVSRAATRLGIQLDRAGSGKRAPTIVRDEQFQLLRSELGTTPARQDGFTRAQLRVLAALARAPRGLISARAVARRAGVSPATASRELTKLCARGLVERRVETLALGRVRDVAIWSAETGSDEWSRVAGIVNKVELHPTRRPVTKRVPSELRHLFWNTAPSQLGVGTAGAYIARRLITAGDLDGLAWGIDSLDRSAWMHAAATRGLSPQQRALATNLAAAAQ